MKQRVLVLFLSLLLLVVTVEGGLAWTLSSRLLHADSLLESGPYDTRPCLTHPSKENCDGKIPVAPWDAEISAGRDGNETCLDGAIQAVAQIPVTHRNQQTGILQIIRSPRCQSNYAHLSIHRAVTDITLHILLRRPPPRAFSFLTDFGGGLSETNDAYSPLVFQAPGDRQSLVVTAVVDYPDGTYDISHMNWTP
jgi:hypothetical protein